VETAGVVRVMWKRGGETFQKKYSRETMHFDFCWGHLFDSSEGKCVCLSFVDCET